MALLVWGEKWSKMSTYVNHCEPPGDNVTVDQFWIAFDSDENPLTGKD